MQLESQDRAKGGQHIPGQEHTEEAPDWSEHAAQSQDKQVRFSQ